MKKTYRRKVTFEEVREEVINRQKRYGTEISPNQCKNPIFKGLRLATMIFLINHWPKCNECNQYLELEIEYTNKKEIPSTILYAVTESNLRGI